MIIFFASAKGGVGSSTLAALTAKERSGKGRVLLIDAARDPSLDLYTSTEHLVHEPFTGSLLQSAVPLDDTEAICLVRIEPERLIEVSLTQDKASDLFSDLIFDLGLPDEHSLGFLQKAGDSGRVVVVLTQDNEVLRAADRLLGSLRELGVRAELIVNKMEERDARELADLDEIFTLLEEDYLGFVRYDHSLRYEMNRGKIEEVSSGIRVNVASINSRLNGEGENPTEAEGDKSQASINETQSVLARVRKFFRSLGNGN